MARGRKKKKDQSLRRGHEENARRAARWHRLREIAGVGFVAITIAGIIALASYSTRDPSFNVVTGSGATHNYLGVFGAYFADLLVQLFGFGAWLFPLHTFGAAVLCFTHIPISFARRIGRLVGLTVFSLSLVTLGNLAFRSADPLYSGGGQPVRGGGVVGEFLANQSLPLLSVTGTAIVFAFLLVASFTLATHLTPRRIALFLWTHAQAAAAAVARARDLRRGRKEKEQARSQHGFAESTAERTASPRPAEAPLEIGEEDLAGPMIVHRPPPLRRKPGPRRPEPARARGNFVLRS